MTLDTLGYVKRLEAAGVPRPQAEAHAEALRDEVVPQLATKPDLDNAVTRLEARFDALAVTTKSDLETAIARLETAMVRNSVAMLLGVLAIGSFLVRFLR